MTVTMVHLVRQANGSGPLGDFLDSVRSFPPGIDVRLLLMLKGFDDRPLSGGYGRVLEGVAYQSVRIEDEGYDIGAYFSALDHVDTDLVVFLNSFSRALVHGWLDKLVSGMDHPGVGAAGASGSWESPLTNELRTPDVAGLRFPRSLVARIRKVKHERWLRRRFDPFPATHLRTNAFIIRRDVMASLARWPFLTKWDVARFEAGKDSMTNQLRRLGLDVVVVDARGTVWGSQEWPDSHTFRAGSQEGLLVEDNRTRQYSEADQATKLYLQRLAWGDG